MGRRIDSQMPPELSGEIKHRIQDLDLNEKDWEYLFQTVDGSTHIKEVYIYANGKWGTHKHKYEGGYFDEYKESEGKYYATLGRKAKVVWNKEAGRSKNTLLPIPIHSEEVVEIIPFETIVNKWKTICAEKGIKFSEPTPEAKLLKKEKK